MMPKTYLKKFTIRVITYFKKILMMLLLSFVDVVVVVVIVVALNVHFVS